MDSGVPAQQELSHRIEQENVLVLERETLHKWHSSSACTNMIHFNTSTTNKIRNHFKWYIFGYTVYAMYIHACTMHT